MITSRYLKQLNKVDNHGFISNLFNKVNNNTIHQKHFLNINNSNTNKSNDIYQQQQQKQQSLLSFSLSSKYLSINNRYYSSSSSLVINQETLIEKQYKNLIEEAIIRFEADEMHHVMEPLDKAIKLLPNSSIHAYLLKADIYFFNGQIKESTPFYEKALLLDPTNVKLAYTLARASQLAYGDKRAIPSYQRLLQLDPKNEYALYRLFFSTLEDEYFNALKKIDSQWYNIALSIYIEKYPYSFHPTDIKDILYQVIRDEEEREEINNRSSSRGSDLPRYCIVRNSDGYPRLHRPFFNEVLYQSYETLAYAALSEYNYTDAFQLFKKCQEININSETIFYAGIIKMLRKEINTLELFDFLKSYIEHQKFRCDDKILQLRAQLQIEIEGFD
ncbi:hypothetical protein CYY_008738 [Polysphondylium violaceum]|uniref:TPR repeat-containing protein n=1 Tax=Polysphondylium violaceum TaxID=133409 RepID=A0A8J4PUQ2_9MYCE|nr:hypothetical protein CYY_008738 [Polysphondylium violaceum]